MHDLDRIMAEVDMGEVDLGESRFSGEDGTFGESSGETQLDEILQEADYEVDQAETVEQEWSGYEAGAYGSSNEDGVLSEQDEIALATELLGINSEGELDQFLGKLFKRAWRGVRRVARGVIKPLGGVLKGIAKRALPILGGAVGTMFGGPLGGALGSKLASGAGQIFGLEVEGLSGEDQEFEVARRFVRLASSAAAQAARVNPANPRAAVRAAIQQAARRHAPGLLQPRGTSLPFIGRRQRGIWIRRGRAIILLGA